MWPFKCGRPFLVLLMTRRDTRTTQAALPMPMPVLVRAGVRAVAPLGSQCITVEKQSDIVPIQK